MPKQTFFNLTEQKRKKLLDAIRAEFSRVPFDEVSINQIVRGAGIPRGSFYQYFDDKQDMLDYLMSEYRALALEQARQSLARTGGDLFGMLLDLLDFTHAFLSDEANNHFIRNIFADARHNIELLVPGPGHERANALARGVLSGVDREKLDIRTPDDFNNMLGILIPVTGHAFARAFYGTSNYAAVRAQFAGQLALLRRGFMKNKGENTPVKTEQ